MKRALLTLLLLVSACQPAHVAPPRPQEPPRRPAAGKHCYWPQEVYGRGWLVTTWRRSVCDE